MSENRLNIRRLVLRRFRSIRADNVELSNPLFLVGKNGSGKSNLVDVFAFLSECMSLPLHTVFENRGGINAVRYRSGTKSRPGNFAVRVEFDFLNEKSISGWYAFEIRASPDYTFSVVREQ